MKKLALALLAVCAILAQAPSAFSQDTLILDTDEHFKKLDDYQQCQGEAYVGERCNKGLDEWLASHPDDWGKAAKMVRMNQNAHVAMPYFKTALDKKQVVCADKDLSLAVIGALGLPKDGNAAKIDAARNVVANQCFNELKDPVKNELTDSYVFENICKVMGEKKMLSSLQQKKCDELK